MKKEWSKPQLEILNVKMTMHGMTGSVADGTVKEPDGEEVFTTHGPHS
jgi:hypothetical protein